MKHVLNLKINTPQRHCQTMFCCFYCCLIFSWIMYILLTTPLKTRVKPHTHLLVLQLFSKILPYSLENTCVGVFFIKRDSNKSVVNIAKFLGTTVSQNTSERLLMRVEGLRTSSFKPNLSELFRRSFWGGGKITPPV